MLNDRSEMGRRQRGFSLLEMVFAVAVASILAAVAVPSLERQVHRARRADALVAAFQVQSAEERYRSAAASYGSLADIGAAATSSSGHYRLRIDAIDADGYELLLSAIGLQARDAACRFLKLSASGLTTVQTSGPDLAVANDAAQNRRCWGLR